MFLVAVEFKSIFVCARYIRKYTLIMRFQKNKRRMMKIPEGTFTTWQRHVDSHSRACSKAHLTVFATTRITSTRTESCYFIFTDHCTKTWQKNCKTKGYACSGTRSTSLAMELATGKPRCARSILPFAIKNRLHVQKKISFFSHSFEKFQKTQSDISILNVFAKLILNCPCKSSYVCWSIFIISKMTWVSSNFVFSPNHVLEPWVQFIH